MSTQIMSFYLALYKIEYSIKQFLTGTIRERENKEVWIQNPRGNREKPKKKREESPNLKILPPGVWLKKSFFLWSFSFPVSFSFLSLAPVRLTKITFYFFFPNFNNTSR